MEWYKIYFQKLRYAFPGIRLMILHIQAASKLLPGKAGTDWGQVGIHPIIVCFFAAGQTCAMSDKYVTAELFGVLFGGRPGECAHNTLTRVWIFHVSVCAH